MIRGVAQMHLVYFGKLADDLSSRHVMTESRHKIAQVLGFKGLKSEVPCHVQS